MRRRRERAGESPWLLLIAVDARCRCFQLGCAVLAGCDDIMRHANEEKISRARVRPWCLLRRVFALSDTCALQQPMRESGHLLDAEFILSIRQKMRVALEAH